MINILVEIKNNKKIQKNVEKGKSIWYSNICKDKKTYGEVSEWFKELVLKTSDA